ncbi:MAG: DUF5610 domain-containing protein [Candidatus Hinthialibacter sp.]
MMVDSINSFHTNNLTSPVYESAARDHQERTPPKDLPHENPVAKTRDSVKFQSKMQGSLKIWQNAVHEISSQIQQQLEFHFEWIGESGSAINDTFTLPDHASAQEILAFYNPENTAQRILDYGLNLFNPYLQDHDNSITEENVEEFYHLLGGAFDQGFEKAKDILGPFDGMGEIGESLKQTYNLVMEGLEKFRLEHLNNLGLMPEPSDSPVDEYVESKIQDLGFTL